MQRINRELRLVAPILAIGALGLVAGCGDDDSSDPASISIEASGAEGGLTFEAPSEADAGATEIEFTNSSELEELDAQLAFVAAGEEHSDEEVIAELQKAFDGEAVADWFQAGGGNASTAKGESSSVTQELQEGTYYVLGGEDVPQAPLTKIAVSGGDGTELPEPDATVSAQEYSFSSDGLKAGEQQVLLDNQGGTWHHFLASPLKEGATIEQAKQFLLSEKGEPPFEDGEGASNEVESTVLEGGSSQLVDLDLKPGRYAFFCFVSDKQTGGPPHVVKGMVSELEVSE